MTDVPTSAPQRRAAFIFVFITVLLDMLALGIIIPVLPKLVVDFLAGDAAQRGGFSRLVRHRLGADAVSVLADPRRLGGSFRPPAGDPDFQFRPRPRLRADGAFAEYLVAVRRPRDLGHQRSQHFDRLCLHCRRHAAGRACRALRHARRGLRRRVSCSGRRSAGSPAPSIRACRSGSPPGSACSMGFTAFSCCRNRCRAKSARHSRGGAPIRLARSNCCARSRGCSGLRASISSAAWRMRACPASACST